MEALTASIKSRIKAEPLSVLSELVKKEVNNQAILDFLHDVFNSQDWEEFKQATGGGNHHKKNGGLLEHSLEVACLSLQACDMFECNNNPINRALVLCVALLHDIGKIHIRRDCGVLTHEIESVYVLTPYLQRSKLSKEFQEQFIHCIVTHMSNVRDEGSRALRMMEAYIVHEMDGMSAYLSVYAEQASATSVLGMEITTNFKRGVFKAYDA